MSAIATASGGSTQSNNSSEKKRVSVEEQRRRSAAVQEAMAKARAEARRKNTITISQAKKYYPGKDPKEVVKAAEKSIKAQQVREAAKEIQIEESIKAHREKRVQSKTVPVSAYEKRGVSEKVLREFDLVTGSKPQWQTETENKIQRKDRILLDIPKPIDIPKNYTNVTQETTRNLRDNGRIVTMRPQSEIRTSETTSQITQRAEREAELQAEKEIADYNKRLQAGEATLGLGPGPSTRPLQKQYGDVGGIVASFLEGAGRGARDWPITIAENWPKENTDVNKLFNPYYMQKSWESATSEFAKDPVKTVSFGLGTVGGVAADILSLGTLRGVRTATTTAETAAKTSSKNVFKIKLPSLNIPKPTAKVKDVFKFDSKYAQSLRNKILSADTITVTGDNVYLRRPGYTDYITNVPSKGMKEHYARTTSFFSESKSGQAFGKVRKTEFDKVLERQKVLEIGLEKPKNTYKVTKWGGTAKQDLMDFWMGDSTKVVARKTKNVGDRRFMFPQDTRTIKKMLKQGSFTDVDMWLDPSALPGTPAGITKTRRVFQDVRTEIVKSRKKPRVSGIQDVEERISLQLEEVMGEGGRSYKVRRTSSRRPVSIKREELFKVVKTTPSKEALKKIAKRKEAARKAGFPEFGDWDNYLSEGRVEQFGFDFLRAPKPPTPRTPKGTGRVPRTGTKPAPKYEYRPATLSVEEIVNEIEIPAAVPGSMAFAAPKIFTGASSGLGVKVASPARLTFGDRSVERKEYRTATNTDRMFKNITKERNVFMPKLATLESTRRYDRKQPSFDVGLKAPRTVSMFKQDTMVSDRMAQFQTEVLLGAQRTGRRARVARPTRTTTRTIFNPDLFVPTVPRLPKEREPRKKKKRGAWDEWVRINPVVDPFTFVTGRKKRSKK